MKKPAAPTPCVSVVVPVYNVERYLSRCVESILAQSFADFEVLLVDDGSTDRSGELCDAYAASDPRIRVIHRPNGGLIVARATGVAAAAAPYVVYVDSDDHIPPHALRTLYERAEREQADLVIGNLTRVDELSDRRRVIRNLPPREPGNVALLASLLRREVMATVCARIIRRELLASASMPSDLIIGEDVAVTLQLAERARRVVFVEEPVYYYELHAASSLTHSPDARVSLSRFTLIRWIETYFAEKPYRRDPAFEDAMHRFCAVEFYAFMRSGGVRCPDPELQERIVRIYAGAAVRRGLRPKIGRVLLLYRLWPGAAVRYVRAYMALRALRLRLKRVRYRPDAPSRAPQRPPLASMQSPLNR